MEPNEEVNHLGEEESLRHSALAFAIQSLGYVRAEGLAGILETADAFYKFIKTGERSAPLAEDWSQ